MYAGRRKIHKTSSAFLKWNYINSHAWVCHVFWKNYLWLPFFKQQSCCLRIWKSIVLDGCRDSCHVLAVDREVQGCQPCHMSTWQDLARLAKSITIKWNTATPPITGKELWQQTQPRHMRSILDLAKKASFKSCSGSSAASHSAIAAFRTRISSNWTATPKRASISSILVFRFSAASTMGDGGKLARWKSRRASFRKCMSFLSVAWWILDRICWMLSWRLTASCKRYAGMPQSLHSWMAGFNRLRFRVDTPSCKLPINPSNCAWVSFASSRKLGDTPPFSHSEIAARIRSKSLLCCASSTFASRVSMWVFKFKASAM